MLRVIGAARRRLVLSLFRCDDFEVLDALARALERGVAVHALLTKRAKGGRKRVKKLWEALEEMGAIVEPVAPPFPAEKLWQSWMTLRAMLNANGMKALYDDPAKRAQIKPETIWEIADY